MREKGKQGRSSEERQRQSPEEGPPMKSIETPAPIDEDSYGRRAGEIIARAARHVRDAVHHPGKRK
jgi:hypothetical protein